MPNITQYQDDNFLRKIVAAFNQFNLESIRMGTPVAGAVTSSPSGSSSNLPDGTYTVVATAIDVSGNETIGSSPLSVTLAGGTTANRIAFAAATALTGAASYRIYRKLSSASAYAGYYAITTGQWAAGFNDTGAGSFVLTNTTATPPTTKNKASYKPFDDALISTITTVTGLKNWVKALPQTVNRSRYGRMMLDQIDRATKVGTRFDKGQALSASAVGSGSAYGGAQTVYAVFTSIDANGAESTISTPEKSFAITTADSISWSWTAISGAVSYRLYLGSASGQQTYYLACATNSKSDTGVLATKITKQPPTRKESFSGSPLLTDAIIAANNTNLLTLMTAITNKQNRGTILPTLADGGFQQE